jgi:hypothetical protein
MNSREGTIMIDSWTRELIKNGLAIEGTRAGELKEKPTQPGHYQTTDGWWIYVYVSERTGRTRRANIAYQEKVIAAEREAERLYGAWDRTTQKQIRSFMCEELNIPKINEPVFEKFQSSFGIHL